MFTANVFGNVKDQPIQPRTKDIQNGAILLEDQKTVIRHHWIAGMTPQLLFGFEKGHSWLKYILSRNKLFRRLVIDVMTQCQNCKDFSGQKLKKQEGVPVHTELYRVAILGDRPV